MGLLFLLPGGPLHAQDADGPIMYAENGTGPVATYTAEDPEGTAITWSLEGVDAADFEISAGGVLTFKRSPNYEMATGGEQNGTSNTYSVKVVATDSSDDSDNSDTVDVTVGSDGNSGHQTFQAASNPA